MIHFIMRIKRKFVITSIHVVKAFDKIQHPFIIKIISKLEIERNFSKLIKCIDENLQLMSYLMIKNKCFHLKMRKKTRTSTLMTSTWHCLRVIIIWQCGKVICQRCRQILYLDFGVYICFPFLWKSTLNL